MDLFNKKKIKELNKELARYGEALTERETKCRGLEERVKDLNKIVDNTMSENKKLTEWVIKILAEFGTTEIGDRKHIEIPVHHCEPVYHFYDEPVQTSIAKRIEIPAITILKIDRRY